MVSAVMAAEEGKALSITAACRADNDLLVVLMNAGVSVARYDTPNDAVENAEAGSPVLILADGYPDTPTPVDDALFDSAAAKSLRVYVEYPAVLPGLELGAPRGIQWERAVVVSDWFGPALDKQRILAIHGCRYLPVEAENPYIVMARVAGFDTAVYGLPENAAPILFEHGNLLVATTKLSQFVTARYAPTDAWRAVIARIVAWLAPEVDVPEPAWTPTVRPSFAADAELPEDVEAQAARRGAQWFFNAKLFVHKDWPENGDSYEAEDRIGVRDDRAWPVGDGSLGMLEGFNAAIDYQGRQPTRFWLRNDCMGEGAMALAFDAVIEHDERSRNTAKNLADFIYFGSEATKGPRDDPSSPSFGLMSWDLNRSLGVFYGDDNARSLLGALACAGLLDEDRWDYKQLRCLLANLRTTGPLGFRGGRIDEGPLHANGWRHYFDTERTFYAPHYEAYLWACFLWAYARTGYAPFLERTRNAIGMTMAAYPEQWQWTNGLQQERARLLLPLAWLVRVDDTPEHREWLRFMAGELVKGQAACGAIREELGPAGKGAYAPPASNEAYGTSEAPLIQANGDPLCDLLYTTNFAFLGLHEAAEATGDAFYRDAETRLARFLCRIQVRSEAHPELDGAWFRAFDFDRWEYWASSADLGWGAWSIESGWTCGWITAVLSMRHMDTSLWEITEDSAIGRHLDDLLPLMLPEGG